MVAHLVTTTLLILFVVVTCVDSQLCRLKAPSNITKGVWPGTDVLLNCTVFGGSVDHFSWKKDGHVLSNVKRVSPIGQDGRHLLTWEGIKLDNISGRDDGEYRCIVSKDGATDEDWMTLHIFAKPRITSPQQVYMESQQGSSIVSTCSAAGWPKPTVFWRKKGSNSQLSNAFVTHFGVVLHIVFVRKEDNGYYSCYANNSIGTDNRTLLLHVSIKDKPRRTLKVTVLYDHVVAYVSQSLTLRCKGLNVLDKYTVVYWEYNGKPLHVGVESHRFPKVDEVDFWYTLHNVTIQDAGNYTCAVQTDRGKDARVIKLDVKRNGPPIVSTLTNHIQTNFGWPATLSCTFSHVDTSRARLLWFKNETKTIVVSSEHQKIKTTTTNEGTVKYSLMIRNVSKQHLGCYGCYVNTSYGWNSSVVCLRLANSKDLFSKLHQSYSPPSKPVSTMWYTTLPIFLVCTVVCMAGFIIGLLVRRKKAKHSDYWVSGDNRESYQYDVFITFSSKDFQWVKSELLPLIEKHNLNYCIHHRDFEPGKTIVENIADSVYKSRHILAVLSKNYMSSTFCRGELDLALGRNTQMKDSSLIAIRVDEIEKKCLPKALRSQMFLDFYNHAEKEALESQLTKELIKSISG